MIQIKHTDSGQTFDTDSATKVRLEFNNTMFGDVRTKSRTYPFTLPRTARNNLVLGMPERAAAGTVQVRHPVSLELGGGISTQSGTLIYQGGAGADAGGGYPVRIQIDDTLAARALPDADLPTLFKSEAVSFSHLDNGWETNPYVRFPRIRNEKFFGGVTPPRDFNGYLNRHLTEISPQPVVHHLLRRIGAMAGINFTGSFMNDAELADKLLLYATHNVTVSDNTWDRLLPESLTPAKLVKLLKDMFCLTTKRRGSEVELIFRKDILARSSNVDWTSKVQLRTPLHQPSCVELKFADRDGNGVGAPAGYVISPNGIKIGDPSTTDKTTVTSLASAPPLAYDPSRPYELWDGAVGSSAWGTYENIPTTKIPIRFLLYRGEGLRAASAIAEGGYKYGLNIAGAAGGLYDSFWKDWMQVLEQGVTQKGKAWLDAIDLARLDMHEKIRVHGREYLIKKLSTVLTNASSTGTLECDVELVRLPLL